MIKNTKKFVDMPKSYDKWKNICENFLNAYRKLFFLCSLHII